MKVLYIYIVQVGLEADLEVLEVDQVVEVDQGVGEDSLEVPWTPCRSLKVRLSIMVESLLFVEQEVIITTILLIVLIKILSI